MKRHRPQRLQASFVSGLLLTKQPTPSASRWLPTRERPWAKQAASDVKKPSRRWHFPRLLTENLLFWRTPGGFRRTKALPSNGVLVTNGWNWGLWHGRWSSALMEEPVPAWSRRRETGTWIKVLNSLTKPARRASCEVDCHIIAWIWTQSIAWICAEVTQPEEQGAVDSQLNSSSKTGHRAVRGV